MISLNVVTSKNTVEDKSFYFQNSKCKKNMASFESFQ